MTCLQAFSRGFPALGSGYMFLLRVLIGSLNCLRRFLLARLIALVLILRHSSENRSINQTEVKPKPIVTCFPALGAGDVRFFLIKERERFMFLRSLLTALFHILTTFKSHENMQCRQSRFSKFPGDMPLPAP